MILALDQATTTGWALVNDKGHRIDSGIWKLADPRRSGESRGMRYVRFRAHLRQMLTWCPVTLICHEQTLLRGGAATEIANGLKALILEAAADKGIDVTCVHTTELKKWATGSGSAKKDDMVKACVSRSGHTPIDDNEADAVLIGLWAFSQYGARAVPSCGIGIDDVRA